MQADVEIRNEGSVVAFELISVEAHDWVEENVQSDGYQWLGAHTLVVDHRFAAGLAEGLAAAGLVVA